MDILYDIPAHHLGRTLLFNLCRAKFFLGSYGLCFLFSFFAIAFTKDLEPS